MSSVVVASGRFTVLEMPPLKKGWTAAIMSMCPFGPMASSPKEQANTSWCSALMWGALRIVLCSRMCSVTSSISFSL